MASLSLFQNTLSGQQGRRRFIPLILIILCVVHGGLLAYSAACHSPTQDEVGHLPAGLAIWRFGEFDLYRVNPPLVRAVAALPLLWAPYEEDWSRRVPHSPRRAEWDVGERFLAVNGERSLTLFTWARWACLPFSLLGLLICFAWGRELTNPCGGLIAATLWCFSPSLIGHGSLVTPDVPATSLGLLAAWRFQHWLQQSTGTNAFLAGLSLGLAVLTKSYWLILFGIWPILAAIRLRQIGAKPFLRTLGQLTLILLLGWNLLNSGYLWNGTWQQLGDFPFFSETLSGVLRDPEFESGGNRFHETWLAGLPIPLPADFVAGLDLQQREFELEPPSYLFGEHRRGGWWYYYVIGLAVKVPLGTWLLVIAGAVAGIRHQSGWMRLAPLAVPVVLLFLLASVQTGLQHHVRYVFPILPLLFLIAAQVALGPVIPRLPRLSRIIPIAGMMLTAIGALVVYPHCLSDFNLLAGGPRRGDEVLIHSNIDWGQDLLFVRDWVEQHPDARPVTLAWLACYPAKAIGVDLPTTPTGKPVPGWHIVSRHRLRDFHGSYAEYQNLVPVDRVGWSFNVYHVPDPGGD